MTASTASPSVDGRPVRTRPPVLDPVCAEAVDLAFAAAEDVAGIGEVGAHVGVVADGDRVVTHLFECREKGYRGWNWAVTLTRAPRSKFVTLDETVLISGRDSVLPPAWVPWSERLRPGDLGPGDLLPVGEDDPRLVHAFTGEDEEEPGPYREITRDTLPLVGYEMGLGRPRVLSREGREEAADRWHEGDFGPHSPMAQAAPARCSGCGFLTPLAGMLGQAFGVCANVIAPSDGHVVSLDYGCGAHSEAAVVPATHPTSEPVVDEYVYDTVTFDTVTFGERVVEPESELAALPEPEPEPELKHEPDDEAAGAQGAESGVAAEVVEAAAVVEVGAVADDAEVEADTVEADEVEAPAAVELETAEAEAPAAAELETAETESESEIAEPEVAAVEPVVAEAVAVEDTEAADVEGAEVEGAEVAAGAEPEAVVAETEAVETQAAEPEPEPDLADALETELPAAEVPEPELAVTEIAAPDAAAVELAEAPEADSADSESDPVVASDAAESELAESEPAEPFAAAEVTAELPAPATPPAPAPDAEPQAEAPTPEAEAHVEAADEPAAPQALAEDVQDSPTRSED